ncbi:hypothetical protein BC343_10095 [Mucilaginibacter pedocola]|uniref:Uncharacterized protein n=2 Tax=Mucilaginibacter pedocola TaxID=1792845 RepID=A0A1S9PBJ3_9SPHI|nr:hypothetical protein BC343_10095 [Mucilaginibacter pedocola]
MKRVRLCIKIMITGLFLSGVTAFPLETELNLLANLSGAAPEFMHQWIDTVYQAIRYCNKAFPFLSYGTDWLAFAHVMLAVLFIGPLRNPVKNIWVIEFGMIACVLILPLAFIMGPIRHIPLFWTLVDCSFGIFGIIPLYIAYINTKKLEAANKGAL